MNRIVIRADGKNEVVNVGKGWQDWNRAINYLVEVHYPENRYNGWNLVAAAYDLKLATKIKKLIEEE